jgi:hypothetical protein
MAGVQPSSRTGRVRDSPAQMLRVMCVSPKLNFTSDCDIMVSRCQALFKACPVCDFAAPIFRVEF